jgi:DNA-binding beta-propeller fold protein YncE
MKYLFSRYALSVCASATILVSCSGLGSQSPLGASSPEQSKAARWGINSQGSRDRSRSWMAPDAKSADLLYISDAESGDLYVYSYPQAKLKGTLTGLDGPEGECVDKAGNVFVANTGETEILEYAHGGTTPKATFGDSGYYPVGCAVDPTTGNLAVTNICQEEYGQCVADGDLLIYAGKHTKSYSDPLIAEYYFCGYDPTGNLYVDGLYNSNFAFGELPHHTSSFTTITLDTFVYQPGGVQWDGKYVAIGNEDLNNNAIYEFSISGSQGKLARPGGTPLDGATLVGQFWIQGKVVVGPNRGGSGSVMFWKYPGGGSPTKVLHAFSSPIGAAVSMANS